MADQVTPEVKTQEGALQKNYHNYQGKTHGKTTRTTRDPENYYSLSTGSFPLSGG